MSETSYILAIDQGTTSTKALVINQRGQIVGSSAPAVFGIGAHHPSPGWVEYDPDRLFETVCGSARDAVKNAGLTFSDIAGLGLANQGETVIAFDRRDGRPVYPAISWQDRRAEEVTGRWLRDGLGPSVFRTTGLRLDPYFSAPKLSWIYQNIPRARELQQQGRLVMGTSDTWLLWKLSGGRHLVTDPATASRTMLFDLAKKQWSNNLAATFGLDVDMLPGVVSNAGVLGTTDPALFGVELPISGMCVDQQAALFGHRALDAGDTKATYGTGCFLLSNIGEKADKRVDGLITSVGWQTGEGTTYVVDGGVYSAGSLVNWMVDLGLAHNVRHLFERAASAENSGGVTLIPAFSGLAAPRWSGKARAAWTGMHQGTDRRHLIRAGLEAITFRVRDIVEALRKEEMVLDSIHVDGGLTQSDFLMQLQADVLGIPVHRHNVPDCTAVGVGLMAGVGCGLWESIDKLPSIDVSSTVFLPRSTEMTTLGLAYENWMRISSKIEEMGEDGLFTN